MTVETTEVPTNSPRGQYNAAVKLCETLGALSPYQAQCKLARAQVEVDRSQGKALIEWFNEETAKLKAAARLASPRYASDKDKAAWDARRQPMLMGEGLGSSSMGFAPRKDTRSTTPSERAEWAAKKEAAKANPKPAKVKPPKVVHHWKKPEDLASEPDPVLVGSRWLIVKTGFDPKRWKAKLLATKDHAKHIQEVVVIDPNIPLVYVRITVVEEAEARATIAKPDWRRDAEGRCFAVATTTAEICKRTVGVVSAYPTAIPHKKVMFLIAQGGDLLLDTATGEVLRKGITAHLRGTLPQFINPEQAAKALKEVA